MGFILPALAMALANKVIGGNQQQPPTFDPRFGQKPPRYRYQPMPQQMPWSSIPAERPFSPQTAAPVDPITAAMTQGPQQPANPQQGNSGESGQSDRYNAKDAFLSTLTQSLVQRILFGNGQQRPSYSPPTWR